MHVVVGNANFLESVKFYHTTLNTCTKSIMKFIFKTTLEHIALMKLVSALWNQHDIRALLEEFSITTVFLQVDDNLPLQRLCDEESWTGEKEEKWQTIETRVVEKIPIMQTSLKDKTIGYIKPIGLQVLRWMEYHRKCFCLDLKLPSEFCWTPQGTIDKKKTAEVLIKDETINIFTRYKLACIYCLEYDIPELWNKIPESLKVISHTIADYISDPREVSEMALLRFWKQFKKGNVHWESKIIIGRAVNLQNSYVQAFRSAAIMANKAATEYFLSKVQQGQVSLVQTALLVTKTRHAIDAISHPPREYYGEVLCFLLSQMNDGQQLRVFQRSPCNVMISFLEWPWQAFFVEIASQMCRIVCDDGKLLFAIVSMIVRKVKLGFTDNNYRKMYGELLRQLPYDYGRRIINDIVLAGIVKLLLEINDSENIKLTFRNAMSRDIAFVICRTISAREEWDLLKFFIQQCVTSKDEMIKFKEKVMEHASKEALLDNLDKFSQVLDDVVRGFDKRKSIDEGECSAAKRLSNNSDSACEENSNK